MREHSQLKSLLMENKHRLSYVVHAILADDLV